MSMPKKKSRVISVNGTVYRWAVSAPLDESLDSHALEACGEPVNPDPLNR